jgi:hypothetical protein
MSDNPLKSLAEYSHFITETLDRPGVQRSTVVVWSDSPYTGTAEGEVFFAGGVRLRMREELDFNAGLITSYGYEVYQGEVRMYWYDDFPHPGDLLFTGKAKTCQNFSGFITGRLRSAEEKHNNLLT